MNSGLDFAVAALAGVLGESQPEPLAALRQIIQLKGVRFAQHILEKAQQREAAGGMLTADKSRRRTLGGTFFAIARRHVSPEEHAQLWPGHTPPNTRSKRGDRDGPADRPTTWEANRADIYPTLTLNAGKAKPVKVTMIGRPGRITHQGSFIATVMQDDSTPDLPRGLPAMPSAPRQYAVLIARKQWDKVAPALQANQDDQLIVEGFAAYDAQLPGLVVHALKVVTKQQQIADRAAQQARQSA
jgi:hypothetical protein